MMEIPSRGALIFPLGKGSKFNWIKIILPVMFFEIVHEAFVMKLSTASVEWVRESAKIADIKFDTMAQLWQECLCLCHMGWDT